MTPAQSSLVSDGDDGDDDDDNAATSSVAVKTSCTGRKSIPPKRLPRPVSPQTPHTQFSRLLATFDTQQDDLISKVLTTFNEENKFLHCQLAMYTLHIGTLYKAVWKIFTTEIFTTTLGHQIMDFSLGDLASSTTQELHAILSTVPSYRHLHTKTHLANILSSSIAMKMATIKFVLPGVHLLESFRPARCFVFRVLGYTVLYQNYALSHGGMSRCINPTYFYRLYPPTTTYLTTRKSSTNSLTIDSFIDLQSMFNSV
ncbi:unnamed protein product [Clavelina lepadiformis]|uniref:Uncharacterized protein n=1 Tax=Clavelina lepadiformis TaxID=159417 RepID=A0ABP0FCC0_CLALP